VDDVCAVIVSREADQVKLEACIGSLRSIADSIELDVVVVDVGSGRIAEYVDRSIPGARSLAYPDRSAGYARNRVLEATDARYALFVAPDVEAAEGSISQLTSALDSFPNIAATGVRQVCTDDSLAPTIGRFPSTLHMLAEAIGLAGLPGPRRFLGERLRSAHGYKLPRTCDWVCGSFMLVRTAALDGIGWFDERLLCVEDTDLCWRLRRFGWEVVYLPCMTVRNHQHDRLENPRQEARMAYGRMQFARKHFPTAAAEYRWALALRYALRVGAYSLRGRYESHRKRAARAALDTVVKGHPPFEELSLV
jgi:N-acetylglucosaminyl-diphospho-decaprenol L-rhamnosyltransferase